VTRRLWGFAAAYAAWLVFAWIFGLDVYVAVGTAVILIELFWFVGLFLVGVWRGWRGR
jgi:hypothetical protein